jgi:imidazolonepropionase-like amidohydrolase
VGSWTIVSGGTVIDGTGAPARPNCDVVFEDDRIVEIGEALDVASIVPRGAPLQSIDAAGKTVMPGLIDVHCHTSFGEVRMQEEQCLYTSREIRVLRSATNLPRMLRAGVTSVSVPGGSYFIDVGLREGVNEGIINGPRMAVASRFLSTDNGIGSYYPSDVGVPDGSVGLVVNTPDEMVRAVRYQIKNGVDLIKIGDSTYGQHEAFSTDEMKMIVDAAHRLNKKVTIHARGSANVSSAVKAGVDWIQHANVMTDEVIDELAASKIPVAPVLVLLANLLDFGAIIGVPVWKREVYKRLLDNAGEVYNKARKAGVVFMTGTDSGFAAVPYGEWHARELEMLVTYAGLTPLEAIAAATSRSAIALCGNHNVGSIEVGKGADILIVNGDPLKDIRVLQDHRNIATVISRGRVQSFDDDLLAVRHPYDRAQHIAPSEITWDLVFGDGDATGVDTANLNDDIAKDIINDLRQAGRAAAGHAE